VKILWGWYLICTYVNVFWYDLSAAKLVVITSFQKPVPSMVVEIYYKNNDKTGLHYACIILRSCKLKVKVIPTYIHACDICNMHGKEALSYCIMFAQPNSVRAAYRTKPAVCKWSLLLVQLLYSAAYLVKATFMWSFFDLQYTYKWVRLTYLGKPCVIKPGVHPHAWFPEIVYEKFLCVYVCHACMYICLSFCTHVSKLTFYLKLESSLYTKNKG